MRLSQRCLMSAALFCSLWGSVLAYAETPSVYTDKINPELLYRPWSARWIAPPDAPPTAYGVYHFRRAFDLATAPTSFVVHVTGDNRYELFVNGARVVSGPARGDLTHWRYETVDLARLPKPGRNVLAA